MRKIVETRSSLSNTIKDTSTIMRNPSLHNSEKGILDSIAKGTSCFHYFSHGASLHPHSFSRMIFTLVYILLVWMILPFNKGLPHVCTFIYYRQLGGHLDLVTF